MMEGFDYIETAFDGAQNRNNLIKTSNLKQYAKDWKQKSGKDFIDCYMTYFRYPEEMLEHFKQNNSVKGYTGPVYSDYVPTDVDNKDNLIKSLQDTKAILHHLRDNFDVDIRNIGIYFSGSKGFHLEIPSGLFGFEPSPDLPAIFKRIVQKIVPDGIEVDMAIYEHTRLWRLQNTINSKSGLYKIPLTVHELFNLEISEILELAKKPRRSL